jgi:hypothetical protein
MRRVFSQDLPLASDVDAEDYAQFAVYRYKTPSMRFERIDVDPLDDTTIWQTLLGREFGDRITVNRRPPQYPAGAGGTISLDQHIEAIAWTIEPAAHGVARLQLSPATTTAFWSLGDSVNGLLGQTTALSY